MPSDNEIIDMGDGCKLIFDKYGNIKIGKGCDGKIINRAEITLFNKVTNIIEDEKK